MYIEQVTIRNFRCFEHLEVKLNPDVNVFVGNNGSGKSALLDAIIAASYPYISEIQSLADIQVSFESPTKISDFRLGEKLRVEGDISFQISGYGFPCINSKYEFNHFSDDFEEQSKSIKPTSISGLSEFSNRHGYISSIESIHSSFPLIIYYQGDRNLSEIKSIEKISRGNFDRYSSLYSCFNAAASFQELVEWFFMKEIQELRAAKKSGDINKELEELKSLRFAISSLVRPASEVSFSQETTRAELVVRWTDELGDCQELFVNQLSSGYRNMLAMVMDFARRLVQANPSHRNPLAAEAILLIDEIDLHLHPTWQQTIIPDLRKVFPNTQIIVTTHSPEIVTTVEQHQVFLLENYQIKDCPSPTRGMKSSDVVRYVLGLEDLRPETPEKQTLTQLFAAIDDGDIESAKRLREELKSWESFDGDLTRADMQIRRMERRASA